MKIAIFHNFMDNIGGAEIVTLTLARELGADIYTTNIDTSKISKMGFSDILPRIYSIGKLPKNAPFRQQLALWKFRKLNLGNKYNHYIISGDWAMSGAVNNKPNIWYVHSPLNELWQFKNYIKKELLSWWKRPLYEIWVWFNRKLTLKYSRSVGTFVCNSKNTQERIKRFYNKDAEIIYPPIDTKQYYCSSPKNYWLSVNRLLPNKRIDMQMGAFAKLPDEKLIIVGSYEKDVAQFEEYKKYLENIKPENVLILNWVDEKQLKKLYSECNGFITTSRDEDFGMAPIEAMASGKVVIAPNEGGYRESVTKDTGILIDNIDEIKLSEAIRRLSNNTKKYKDECIKRASEFDISIFIIKIKSVINKKQKNGQ